MNPSQPFGFRPSKEAADMLAKYANVRWLSRNDLISETLVLADTLCRHNFVNLISARREGHEHLVRAGVPFPRPDNVQVLDFQLLKFFEAQWAPRALNQTVELASHTFGPCEVRLLTIVDA